MSDCHDLVGAASPARPRRRATAALSLRACHAVAPEPTPRQAASVGAGREDPRAPKRRGSGAAPRAMGWVGAWVVACALGVAGCSREAAPPPVAPSAPPDAPAVVAPAGVAWVTPRSEAELDAAFATARTEGKPVFMVWGAVWCPSCAQVKTTLFPRADFIERSRQFVAIYLDGDIPGAQKLGTRFKVSGYPSMLVFGADGLERTRLPGEVDPERYLEVLDVGLGQGRSQQALLQQALATPGELDAKDWRRLAYYGWDIDEQALGDPAQLAPTLQRLAAACPPGEATAAAATRLRLKAVLASAEAPTAAKPDRAATTAALRALQGVLADPLQAREHLDLITLYPAELSEALSAPGSRERRQLVEGFDARLAELAGDAKVSQGDRLTATLGRLQLAQLDGGRPSEALRTTVRDEAARADRDVTSPVERQAVVPTAAYALGQAGWLDEADALLQAELKRSPTPDYAMRQLAANAKRRGDREAALRWSEQAWQTAQGPATRLQWGSSHVLNLLELAPDDGARVEQAVDTLLVQAGSASSDAFHGRNAKRLQSLARKLAAWAKTPERQPVLARVRERTAGLCAKLPPADSARATCTALFPDRA